MKLIIITTLIAVCHTAKLDRTYLPPPSAATAGGNHNLLQAPLIKASDNQVTPQSAAPLGSYTNEFEGVVVDAAAPGTRASSENELSGLGAPRPSYGSTDSKVGEAAFRGSIFQGQGNVGMERPQANKDRNSNILTYSNDVNPDAYSYGFETDNGIAVGENGIAANGIQAEGGYSYQGDDGQTYKVTYVADEKGYRPQGAHLPTPPPIPDEILKSLQQNAQEEAAGIVDDGSYDAQKYNGDYTHHNAADISHNEAQLSQFGKRPESDTSASANFINQNNQAVGTDRFGTQATQGHFNQGNQFEHQHQRLQDFSGSQGSQSQFASAGQSNGHYGHQTSQFGLTNQFNNLASQSGAQIQSTRPSGFQFGTQVQSTQSSEFPGTQLGSQIQSTQHSGSQFGAQAQYTQSSPGTRFGSQIQSTQPSESQYGNQAQGTRPSGSQFGAQAQYTQSSGSPGTRFGSQIQSTQPSESQYGNQAQGTRPSGSQFGAQAQYTQSSGSSGAQIRPQVQSTQSSGSQYGIQAPGAQFGAQAQFSQQSGTQFGVNPQSTHSFRPQVGNQQRFGSQSNIQTKPQPEGLKPTDASASSSFSQSSVTPSPVSGNQFNGMNGNKPFNAFNSNNKFGVSSSSNINSFAQTTNQFVANNEYLPPSNVIQSKPQFGATNTFNNGQNQNRPTQNYNSQTQTQGFQQNSAFAIPLKPNNFQSQTPSRPSQFSGNFQSSQNQQFNSQLTPAQQFQNSQTVSNLKPTSIPDTELTTPVEPNEVSTSSQSEYSSQTSTSFGSSIPSFSGSKPNVASSTSNLGSSTPSFITSTSDSGVSASTFGGSTTNFGSSSSSFGSSTPNSDGSTPSFGSSTSSSDGSNKRPSNQFGQSQQFNTQENLGSNSQTFPSTASTPRPQTSSFQNNNGRPQFQQNYFNQNLINQNPDDSYYYNQPSKPFDTPQGSRFPSSPSYQSTVGQYSQFSSQQNSFPKVPGSPVLSTSTNQFTQNQGSSTNFNGITQAAISPFPSISPTSSTQFGTIQNNQYGSKPTFGQSQSPTNQPSTVPSRPQFGQKPTVSQSQTTQNGFSNFQTDSQNKPTSQNQQYTGTVYEYNKPAETLPSAQSDSDSSQTIQSNIVSSKPEVNKPTTTPQISLKPSQASQFGQNSFTQSQQSDSNQDMSRPQFGLQSNNVPNRFGQTNQYGSQFSTQQQSIQPNKPASGSSLTDLGRRPIGLAQQPLGTTGSGYLGYPSAQDSKPQFGSDFGEISQFPTVDHSHPNFNSQAQTQNQQNVGFDYKPQFSQNQFSKPDQTNLGSDSLPFSNTAVTSIVPSPSSKPFVPQSSAQAAVSSEPLDFLPLSKPQNQFNQPSTPQPIKSNQPSRFGSQYSSFQGSTAGKGEEFGGPRPPPSFDDKTGYHY